MADGQPRPPHRPYGRSWSDFEPVSEEEKKLAEKVRKAEKCIFNSDRTTIIRACFLRFLALGGDETAPVHEKGVWLQGATIKGQLDLDGAMLPFDLFLLDCRFDKSIILLGARGRTINLQDSHFVGLQGDGLQLDGCLFLHRVHATAEIGLLGARIQGNVECDEGVFLNTANAETVYECRRGRSAFKGVLKGVESCALSFDRAEIVGAFFFRENIVVQGAISFADAMIGTLVDDPSLWPENSLILDGLRYQRISAMSPLDAKTRSDWLKKQQKRWLEGENFALQPWTHLAKVLREQGHFRDAAEVDIEREDLLRRAGRIVPLASPRRWCAERDPQYSTWAQAELLCKNLVPWVFHWLYGKFAAYGYKPTRILYIAFAIWLVFGCFYNYSANRAAFGPSNALVFQNKDYEHCRPDAPATPANGKARVGNWTKCDLPGEYTSFSPFSYSLDLILPLVNLGQAHDWTPITAGEGWSLGYGVRLATWVEEILGWVAALTLAAIASGLVKRQDKE